MIRSLASRSISRRPINQPINQALYQSINPARSFHCQSINQSTSHKLFNRSINPSIHPSFNRSIGFLSIRSFSSKPNVDTARVTDQSINQSLDSSLSQPVDASTLQSINQSINPSLLDDPITHAPMYSHTFSQAWESASGLAFSVTNDHYLPTQAVEFILDFAHLYTGLPWWATIVAVTLAVRTALLPASIFQAKHGARLQQLQPEIKRLQEVLAVKRNSPTGLTAQDQKQYAQDIKAVMEKYKTNPLYALIGPIATMPVFISFFVAIQAMHEIHPTFTAGGLYHVMDLSMQDPYYILPIISSLTLLLPQEILGNTEMQQGAFEKVKWAFRAMAVLMVPLAGQLPAGLFIYWITSNIWTFFQTAALRINAIRHMLGLPLLGLDNKPLPVNHASQPVNQPIQFVDVKAGKVINQRVEHMNKKK